MVSGLITITIDEDGLVYEGSLSAYCTLSEYDYKVDEFYLKVTKRNPFDTSIVGCKNESSGSWQLSASSLLFTPDCSSLGHQMALNLRLHAMIDSSFSGTSLQCEATRQGSFSVERSEVLDVRTVGGEGKLCTQIPIT